MRGRALGCCGAALSVYSMSCCPIDHSSSFQVANGGFGGAAETFAMNSFAAGNNSMAPDLIRLTDPVYQDFVIADPEPETYALMIAGLMAVGFLARRRKS